MTSLNEEIYYSHLLNLDLNAELKQLTNHRFDDCVTVLRIHLMCEQMLVAWICATKNDPNHFNNQKHKPTFSEKLKLASRLGFPEPIEEAFSIINDQRNNFAHDIKFKSIDAGFIHKLTAIVSGFNGRGFDPETISVMKSNGVKYAVNCAHTPDSFKLCIIYFSIQMKISFSVSPSNKLSEGGSKTAVITIAL
ncbi:hypothetical protein HA052_22205 [Chromobacterium haemolyticum]|uniref:RiboL-PSP-HEPN domain-containing protein n=1 Tax=Chromobacterium fluminis TaxID=3044269 RepID=A0ABX0LAU8_9NEIS|nr:hypothetical protein [Chromobacterium haemolyticum]NHR07910.1 hypothetical protein [Chromobacterium haemolyticum]